MEYDSDSRYLAAISISVTGGRDSPVVFAPNSESEEWLSQWQSVSARDLIDEAVTLINADTTVEDACEALLSSNSSCLAIQPSTQASPDPEAYVGLFDFADVNAFLTLAATQHTLSKETLHDNPRMSKIVDAAKEGKVPVLLVSNLSEKNPLVILYDTDTIVELLGEFSKGNHRVLIRSSSEPSSYLGFVTDRSLLSYFHSHSQFSAALNRYLSNPLHSLSLPSLSLRSAVVYNTASETVLDAMKLMSEQGVSSVAIVEDNPTAQSMNLLSAVSVTDIGKMVVRSQDKSILTMPLHQFVVQIKEPHGSTDGEDKYPVYSVSAATSLRYTIEKILATNAHRVFITESPISSSPIATKPPPSLIHPFSPASASQQNFHLRGLVSVVDVLALFARLLNLSDIDPTRMQRHRRASSAATSAT